MIIARLLLWLVRALGDLKTAVEVLGWIGVPTLSGVVGWATSDGGWGVIFLYALAGLAFWVVIVYEGKPLLEDWISRRHPVRVVFDPSGCVACERDGKVTGTRRLRLGIWNAGPLSLEGVRLFVESIDGGPLHKRELHGVGMEWGEAFKLDPSTETAHIHVEFVIVYHDGISQVQVGGASPDLRAGPHEIRLLIEGRDLRARGVRLLFDATTTPKLRVV